MRHGADINLPDTSGNTPMHYAAAYGFIECLELLIEVKAELNPENLWKATPLQIAMLKKNMLCVQMLLDLTGANVNAKDD